MTRTKKSPTSSSGKSTDVRPQVDTPKRSGGSVATGAPLVTRYEVQREVRPGIWQSFGTPGSFAFPDAPSFYRTREEAEAEVRIFRDKPLRIVAHEDLVPIVPLDLEEFVLPLVVRLLRLCGVSERGRLLQPVLDVKRHTVLGNWASLSGWEFRAIAFAPEIPLKALHRRFPFARPRTVEGVLRLLTLHELAHYVQGHNGLGVCLDHKGSREALDAKFVAMEREADVLTRVFWEKGLTAATVPSRRQRKVA